MNALREAEKVLSSMTRAEKAQLLQWVVSDLGDSFPGIESTPDVCSGEARIIRLLRTRIPVWVLEQARRLGVTKRTCCAAIRRCGPRTWFMPGRTRERTERR